MRCPTHLAAARHGLPVPVPGGSNVNGATGCLQRRIRSGSQRHSLLAGYQSKLGLAAAVAGTATMR